MFEEFKMSGTLDDESWMRLALEAAKDAGAAGDVPIGAVVVGIDNQILAVAGNRTRRDLDPTAHAEIVALREAARAIGNYRLTGATVYSTIEPCAMCAGALIQARVARLVYGAVEPRAGAVESIFQILNHSSLNHQISWTANVLAEESRSLMQAFFRERRNQTKVEMRNEKQNLKSVI